MSGYSRDSNGSYIRTGSAPPRWANLFIAVVLALSIGSAGPIPPALAAPARGSANAYVQPFNPKTTICVGKSVYYEVRVYTPPTTSAGISVSAYALPQITVVASSSNQSVGDFPETSLGVAAAAHSTGDADLDAVDLVTLETPPFAAHFRFVAKKVGTTSLSFSATVKGQAAKSSALTVKVINCKFKILLNAKWKYEAEGGTSTIIAVTKKEAMLTLDPENQEGKVTADIVWVETTKVPKYRETNDLRFGTAEISGSSGIDDRLLLQINFKSVKFKQSLCGLPGCNQDKVDLTPDKLSTFSSTNGGAVTKANTISGSGADAPGEITVYVIPVEQK